MATSMLRRAKHVQTAHRATAHLLKHIDSRQGFVLKCQLKSKKPDPQCVHLCPSPGPGLPPSSAETCAMLCQAAGNLLWGQGPRGSQKIRSLGPREMSSTSAPGLAATAVTAFVRRKLGVSLVFSGVYASGGFTVSRKTR